MTRRHPGHMGAVLMRSRQARTHPCVRLFCIIDTLTSASMRPGVNGNIEELMAESRPYRSRPQRQYVKIKTPNVRQLDQRQRDGEQHAAAIIAVRSDGGAAVKFGNEPHDVQTQTEMRLVVPALPLFEQ